MSKKLNLFKETVIAMGIAVGMSSCGTPKNQEVKEKKTYDVVATTDGGAQIFKYDDALGIAFVGKSDGKTVDWYGVCKKDDTAHVENLTSEKEYKLPAGQLKQAVENTIKTGKPSEIKEKVMSKKEFERAEQIRYTPSR